MGTTKRLYGSTETGHVSAYDKDEVPAGYVKAPSLRDVRERRKEFAFMSDIFMGTREGATFGFEPCGDAADRYVNPLDKGVLKYYRDKRR